MNDELDAFKRPRAPWQAEKGLGTVLREWRNDGAMSRNFTLDVALDPRDGNFAELPKTLAPQLADALRKRGIESLYRHQVDSYELVRRAENVVIATPTASGKSLCYNLPVLDRLAVDPSARALYLFPTKALARDQEQALRSLMQEASLDFGAITYDGDTPVDARRAAREKSSVIFTNPDMLHTAILPHHASWARLFANLRYVVIDELHMYRGVFGSHLANVLRRLDRIARFHGSNPVFLFASATIGNPQEHASKMIGRHVELVSESGAPAGPRRVMVYNPPVVNAELGIRASYVKSAVRLAADLVRADVPTIVFGQSRNTVEVMLKYLRDVLARDKIDPSVLHAYRGGYLPETRRRVEDGLRTGAIRCVVATNALELGIDIGMLDAVICAGYPGTVAGLWQRFGRAGRRRDGSLALLVTTSMPLDQFVARDPQALIDAPVEHARIDPDNVEILIQHLKCAAFELPFVSGERFGDVPVESVTDALEFLEKNEVLHGVVNAEGKRTYHWATDSYPANHVSLRSVGWDNFVIIDLDSNQNLAEMDWRSTHTMLHEQAIYQHDAEQYQVERLDFENHKAFVRKVKPDYYTDAMSHVRVAVLTEADGAVVRFEGGAPLVAGCGDVNVIEKVVGYKKIKFHTHENVGYGDVHLPEMEMQTTSYWLTVPEDVVRQQSASRPDVIDALRGIGNALHTVAAMGLMVDPRDLGYSVGARNGDDEVPASGEGAGFDPTIFLYDHVPGGVGLAPRIFEERDALLRKARLLIDSCPCEEGCPACIGPEANSFGPPAAKPFDAPSRKRIAQTVLSSFGVLAIQ